MIVSATPNNDPIRLRIAGVVPESVSDGPGLRTTIFFQGCPHACPGCHNPHTWRFDGGREYSLHALLESLPLNFLISGVTFSGGEPFAQAVGAARLAACIKAVKPNLWVYSGYCWEDLLARRSEPGFGELIEHIDVLVDGPYRQELRSTSLPFRGSSNQRLICVPESLRAGRVVEMRIENFLDVFRC
ncbi:MAG: anaerobic ribonucleoside-triphosphate reductase activating protein [Anaerolineaceae bacterium]|nr:anaerobic ribonucleoside-triphosphate reductase activating protein [Anaerolineaceae bacterium]